MQNLLDELTYRQTVERLNKLQPDAKAQWGKMNNAQMLAHCKEAFKVPLSEQKMPRILLGALIGWMIKPKLYNDAPWKKNLPTSPDFIIKDQRNFEEEKSELLSLVNKFYARGPEKIGLFPHPMFGSFTSEQWGKSMFKHLDHHLKQFGV
ncbi:MAG: hypothetical protein JWQ27_1579 [Ferruginibacter sp.]|nr:hypothetical protein [Ferruginibacter sp.]